MKEKPIIKQEICKSCIYNKYVRKTQCHGCISEQKEYKTGKKYLSKPSNFIKPGKTYRQLLSHIKRKSIKNYCSKRGEKLQTDNETNRKIRMAISRSKMYAELLGFDQRDVMEALIAGEECGSGYKYWSRDLMPRPSVDINIFETREEFNEKFPSGKFQCSHCEGITTDPFKCNDPELRPSILKRYDPEPCHISAKILAMSSGHRYKRLLKTDRVYYFIIKEEFFEDPGIKIIHRPIELDTKEDQQ